MTSPAPAARPPAALLTVLLVLVLIALSGVAGAPAGGAPATTPRGTWPLAPAPRVVQPFAPPPVPWARGHRGADLAGRAGQEVRSALPGVVRFSGVVAGRGVVVVGHGATRTTYEPVAERAHVGTVVPAGGVIGRLAPGGSHCAPAACLHWGWIRGATYLDPLALVRARAVRLLPLLPRRPPGLTPAGGPGGRRVAGVRW